MNYHVKHISNKNGFLLYEVILVILIISSCIIPIISSFTIIKTRLLLREYEYKGRLLLYDYKYNYYSNKEILGSYITYRNNIKYIINVTNEEICVSWVFKDENKEYCESFTK